MSGRARAKQAVREAGPAVAIAALAVGLTFWGSLAMIEVAFVVMTVGVLWWTATTPIERLRSAAGWPRPLLFGAMALLAAVNASVFSLTGLAPLLLSTGLVAAAIIVGLTRTLLQVGA